MGSDPTAAQQHDDHRRREEPPPGQWSTVFASDRRSGTKWRQHFACALLLRQEDATTLVGSESAHMSVWMVADPAALPTLAKVSRIDQPRGLTRTHCPFDHHQVGPHRSESMSATLAPHASSKAI
jgi:hypothetical protein